MERAPRYVQGRGQQTEQSSFAAPSTGGAATRTASRPPPSTPSMASRPARGRERTVNARAHPTGRPCPEQRASDAHDGRPLLHRDLEVVAHAHRQLRHRAARGRAAAPPTARAARRRSAARPRRAPRGGRRSSGRRRAARAAPASSRALPELVRREAGLGRIGIDVDLEQDAARCRPLGQPRQPLREGDRIDRLDDVEQLDGAARPCCDWSWPTRCQRDTGAPRAPCRPPPGPGSRRASSGRPRRRPAAARRRPSWRRRPAQTPRVAPAGRAAARSDALVGRALCRRGRRSAPARDRSGVRASVVPVASQERGDVEVLDLRHAPRRSAWPLRGWG